MTILPLPLPPVTYAVWRYSAGRWQPISRIFATERQAHRHLESLPTDWATEVREVYEPEAA